MKKIDLKLVVKNALMSDRLSPAASCLRGNATVLCYHRLTKERFKQGEFRPNSYLCVRDDCFEEQIRYLSRTALLTPLDQVVKDLSLHEASSHKIAITFDDGYRDNLEFALPVLEKYNVPATIFVSPGLIDQTAPLWWEELAFIVSNSQQLHFDWSGDNYHFSLDNDVAKNSVYLTLNKLFKSLSSSGQISLLKILRSKCKLQFQQGNLLMSWEELQKLSGHPLITLGCHTLRHPILSNESESDALNEISEGRSILSAKVEQDIDLFAYPVGGRAEAGEREFGLSEKSGFKAAFTTRFGHIFNKHQKLMHSLPRLTVDYYDCLDDFKWKLSGFAALFKNSRERFRVDL